MNRSSRADVRNPMLRLPEVREEWAKLPADSRVALINMLRVVSKGAHREGNYLWSRHKPPMAAYWRAKAVDARHLALAGAATEKAAKAVKC